MDKPTPGPWEWVGGSIEGPDHADVMEITVNCMAYCAGGSPVTHISEADKALIAAAPDLLEAAKQARDALRAIRDSGPGLIAQHGDALDSLLAAIARTDTREGHDAEPYPCPDCGSPMLDDRDGMTGARWFCANGHRAAIRTW